MNDQRGGGRKPGGGRQGGEGSRPGRPSRTGAERGTRDDRRDDRRDGGRGARRDDRRGGGREARRDDRRDDRRDGPRGARRDRSEGREEPRSERQRRYDGPEIPEHITGRELDRSVAGQLRSLPEKLAARVARHLVAAGQLLESDPQTAYRHTLAARERAGRLAIVREAVGEAAYAAGEYAEALSELRSARRMNGSTDYLAVMADCERALQRPDRALKLIREAPKDGLSAELRAELTIVEAGARRDRGEHEAALRTLESARLDSPAREPWVARLRYVYADTLAEVGRRSEALEWFHRTEAADAEGLTDAAARAARLERGVED